MHSAGWWPPKRHCTQKVKQCKNNSVTIVNYNMLKLSLITCSKMLLIFTISSLFLLDPLHKLVSVCTANRSTSLKMGAMPTGMQAWECVHSQHVYHTLPGTSSPLKRKSTVCAMASLGVNEIAYVCGPWAWADVGTRPPLTVTSRLPGPAWLVSTVGNNSNIDKITNKKNSNISIQNWVLWIVKFK